MKSTLEREKRKVIFTNTFERIKSMKSKALHSITRNKSAAELYDYSSACAREDTISFLLDYSIRSKENTCAYWRKMKRYYDGKHDSYADTLAFSQNSGLNFESALCPDGYIQVESQIDPILPDFEFSPIGNEDADKAKQREKITRYIRDKSALETKNAENERRLGIQGSAIWKVCWDANAGENGLSGEVVIHNPKPEEIFPDPSATSTDDCEYIGYVYRMHRMKARRAFEADARRLGIDIDELITEKSSDRAVVDIDASPFSSYDNENDTVRITEWWFRQPSDGSERITCTDADGNETAIDYKWKAGDIALSVLVGDTEVRYIPKYWKSTDSDILPFVIYKRISKENSIWGKSELEAIIPMIEAADRDLAFAQLNSAFSSNDIIVAEENALADGCTLDNSPGAVWMLRPGMMGKVMRLGNTAFSENALYNSFSMWRELIQTTTGNYDSFQGSEPSRVTTATGIALLNERAKTRSSLKKIGKTAGFKRLYELIDRTALEYYDDGRVIAVGTDDDCGIVYKASQYSSSGKGNDSYIPCVDVKIHIGDGLDNSKAFTVSAVNDLIRTPITRENYKLITSFVELVGLPMRKEICDSINELFEDSSTDTDNESNLQNQTEAS